MTYEQYLAFTPWEKQLKSAKDSNYARFPHKEMLLFEKSVEKWRGEGLKRNEKTCSHCFLTLLKKIADEYFKYQNSGRGKAKIKEMENNGKAEIEENGSGTAGQSEIDG